MELPSEENGYENDMLHPRFVAVMLQLGDALDIDNDRFHPFAHAFSGHFPIQSQEHYNKHLAIRTLKITPEEIVVEADCETREAMRLIRNECDGIESLLKSSSYYWATIAPKGFSGALPSFKLFKLRLNGKEIPWDLALTRFQISQQKAFSFLQGENIYSGYFPFVRELLQNAIDTTKLQCYEDYKTSSKFRFENEKESLSKPGITNISKIINPVEYPIEISIQCCKLNGNDVCEIIDLKDIVDKEDGNKYGILFSIKDYGTGINTETLRNISDVGTSYKSRKKLLREIPDWLRPTGEFGIGLQSVFLVSDNFFCDTYVRNGECYRIEFLTGANGKNGYINVEPRDASDAERPMTYGTKFQVFINHDKKKNRQECMDAWTGYDPFANGYEGSQIERDIIALTTQILLDIDGQLEDLLFPVYVSVKFDLEKEQREYLNSKLSKVVFDNLEEKNYTEENLRKHMCWIYQDDSENQNGSIIRFEIEQGVCRVDLNQMKIYLWLNDLAVNACIGVDHVVNDNFQSIHSPCKLYYKGILIAKHHINNSGNLLEYIDIQGGRKGRKLIQLSRNGLTHEGKIYVDTVLIPRIYKNLFDVLRTLANQIFDSANERKEQISFSEKILENIIESFKLGQEFFEKNWQKQLVGISLYYNFYMREMEKRQSLYFSQHEEKEKMEWSQAICNVSAAVRERRRVTVDNIHSALVAIEVYADLESKDFTVLNKRLITIADFYNEANKFLVVSKRRDKGDKWINSLIWLKNTERSSVGSQKEEETPILVELLESTLNTRMGWNDKVNQLEEWSNFILNNIDAILEPQSIQQSNFVLSLLQSVSISACFTDVTGNLKVHVLSGKPLGSVFYNVYTKYGLIKKMANRKRQTNAERFAGNVWMGYEPLRIYEIQEDVCNIKEQYIQPSEAFMIFPCTGETVQKLIEIAEKTEGGDWNDLLGHEKDINVIDIYLREMKKTLSEMADTLYSCIVITYSRVRSIDENFFEKQYVGYCRREKVRISEISFWDLLNSGYSLLLGNVLREKLRSSECKRERDSWKKISVESLESKAFKAEIEKRLPDHELIEMLNELIGLCILDNAEAIIGGTELVENQGEDLRSYMAELVQCFIDWEWLWNLVEHLQEEQEIHEIKESLFINSAENTNLISYISEQVHGDKYNVAECYDRIWDDLVRAVIWKRRERFTEKQHFKLLEWMAKKEKNME